MARRAAPNGGGNQPAPGRQDAGLATVQFRDFSLGLTRAGSRPGIPDKGLWENTNGQVIGPGQVQTLASPGAAITTFASRLVSMGGVVLNIGGTEQTRIITVHADGSANATTLGGTVTSIAGAGALNSATRFTAWQDSHVLFSNPYSSWDTTNYVAYPATFTASTTTGSSTITYTGGPMANAAIVPGMGVHGTGIPAGAQVLAVAGTTITLTAAATATGSATMTVGFASPTAMRDIAVFQGRVWGLTGLRTIQYSGPASFSSWESVYAAGSTTLIDPVFPGQIIRILSALEVLWIFGTAAIDTLSNVQIATGTTTTTFQVENLVTGVGTPWPNSIQPLFRTVVFAEPPGIYTVLGSTPQKLSDALDGLFPSVAPISLDAPSAVFVLNGILVYGALLQVAGVPRILIYTRPSWSQADQGSNLSFICTVIDATSGVAQCWGTDGFALFRCFAGATGTYKVSTKLHDFGDFTRRKTFSNVAIEAELFPPIATGSPDIHVTAENGNDSQAKDVTPPSAVSQGVTWVNGSVQTVTWQNQTQQPVTWGQFGRIYLRGPVSLSGQVLGVTLTGTSAPMILGAIAMEVNPLGPWTFATVG